MKLQKIMLILSAVVLVVVAIYFSRPQATTKVTGAQFNQNLWEPLDPRLKTYGADSAAALRTTPTGLQVDIARDRSKAEGVGVLTQFQTSGDFEITLAYQLLSAEHPDNGFGAGVKIWFTLGADKRHAITFGHLLRPNKRNQRVVMVTSQDENGDKKSDTKSFNTSVVGGRLRLVRTGETVLFQAAAPDSERFEELHRADVSPVDIEAMRIQVTTSGSSIPVSAALNSLSFHGERFLIGGAEIAETGAKKLSPEPYSWTSIIAFVAAALLLAAAVWRHIAENA